MQLIEVCLLAGKMVYHGSREGILPFFASVGMNCPARKADSDFLQEVTSQKDQQVDIPCTIFTASTAVLDYLLIWTADCS